LWFRQFGFVCAHSLWFGFSFRYRVVKPPTQVIPNPISFPPTTNTRRARAGSKGRERRGREKPRERGGSQTALFGGLGLLLALSCVELSATPNPRAAAPSPFGGRALRTRVVVVGHRTGVRFFSPREKKIPVWFTTKRSSLLLLGKQTSRPMVCFGLVPKAARGRRTRGFRPSVGVGHQLKAKEGETLGVRTCNYYLLAT